VNAPAYPVKGRVLLGDGKPLTSGKVIFLPRQGGMTAHGEIASDGTFSLKTADEREGAPAGEYKIRIEPGASAVAVKGGRLDTNNLPFPPSYLDEDGETGLIATVRTEATQLEPFRLVAAARSTERGRDSRNRITD
jgi:hypothetical protein